MNDKQVIAHLTGKIDSVNAPEVQSELDKMLAENPESELVIDAGELTYISSAGLRVLLSLTKKVGHKITVQNVSQDVYDIFEMTGFTQLLDVKKKLREFSVEGCEVVGKGALGTVYRVDDDTIVKVYERAETLPMIENEQKRAKQAFLKGIPTAISYDVVKVGDKYGSVFEMVKASTFNDAVIAHPENLDSIVRQYADFMHRIHAVTMEKGELPDARDVFTDYLDSLRDVLGSDLENRLKTLVRDMPEDLHVIHGDIQMKNIMLDGDEPMLIDMDTLSVGDPVFELMGLYVTYILFNEDEPANSQNFLGFPTETSSAIWEKTINYYFDDRDEEPRAAAIRKVQIVGCIRYLFLLEVLRVGDPALKEIRTEHALSHLRELLPQVDGLWVRQ